MTNTDTTHNPTTPVEMETDDDYMARHLGRFLESHPQFEEDSSPAMHDAFWKWATQ